MVVFLCMCHKPAEVESPKLRAKRGCWQLCSAINIKCSYVILFFFPWFFWVSSFHYFPKSVLRGRLLKMSAEEYAVYSLSAITFALSFDSLLPLSQPSSPDKKEPLLRCFARHYETVAMDTQSEQAPHTGSRTENDRCNISHIRISSLSLSSAHKLMDRCVKNAKDQDPKNRPAGRRCGPHLRRCLLRAPRGGLYGIFRLILVFVVSPWRDDLYYLGCEIKGAFLTDLMKLASYKPRELVQIVQLLRFPAKCGREAKHCMEKTAPFVVVQPTGFMILQFRNNTAFDVAITVLSLDRAHSVLFGGFLLPTW